MEKEQNLFKILNQIEKYLLVFNIKKSDIKN